MTLRRLRSGIASDGKARNRTERRHYSVAAEVLSRAINSLTSGGRYQIAIPKLPCEDQLRLRGQGFRRTNSCRPARRLSQCRCYGAGNRLLPQASISKGFLVKRRLATADSRLISQDRSSEVRLRRRANRLEPRARAIIWRSGRHLTESLPPRADYEKGVAEE